MPHYQVHIDKTIDAPLPKVFALFADHNRVGKVLGAPTRRVKDAAGDDPNGVGSVRRVGIGPIGLEETVTAYKPDQLIEYTVTWGGPIRNHLGRIRFSEAGGRTRVNYTIDFDDILPFSGLAVRALLNRAISRGVARIPRMV